MKNLKVYEQFAAETLPTEDSMTNVHFEIESTDFTPTESFAEGNYYVKFKNAEGEDTTIEIAGASEPEYVGDSMISKIETIQDSSSDGKEYSVVGYYDEIPNTQGQYELKKVLIEEV